MKSITIAEIIQALQQVEVVSERVGSILVDHPGPQYLSIFYVNRKGDFIQRSIHFPDREMVEKELVAEIDGGKEEKTINAPHMQRGADKQNKSPHSPSP